MPEHAPRSTDQSALYLELVDNYPVLPIATYRADCKLPAKDQKRTPWDYLLMSTLDGVEYWLPNDEDWFHVVAVDHKNHLAKETGFCEMDDFEHDNSDYRFVMDNSDKQLKCKFKIS